MTLNLEISREAYEELMRVLEQAAPNAEYLDEVQCQLLPHPDLLAAYIQICDSSDYGGQLLQEIRNAELEFADGNPSALTSVILGSLSTIARALTTKGSAVIPHVANLLLEIQSIDSDLI